MGAFKALKRALTNTGWIAKDKVDYIDDVLMQVCCACRYGRLQLIVDGSAGGTLHICGPAIWMSQGDIQIYGLG
jgi:hypothetical protein